MVNSVLLGILRHIKKKHLQLYINIFGLSVSLAITILLTGFITKELETGKSLPESEKIYRLESRDGSWFSKKVYDVITNETPEISGSTYIQDSWSVHRFFQVATNLVNAQNTIYADSGFFDVFNYKVISGDIADFNNRPHSIIITEDLAAKLYGAENPIGKPVTYKTTAFGKFDLTVAAVLKKLPGEAMLRFDAVIPVQELNSVDWYDPNHWGSNNYQIYVKINQPFDKHDLETKILTTLKKHAPEWLMNDIQSIHLSKYENLYFNASEPYDILAHNSITNIHALIVVSLFIIVIACINYINLFTARYQQRLKKIGIQKTLGAKSTRIIQELCLESTIIILIAFFISLVIAMGGINILNVYTDSFLSLSDILSGKSGVRILFIFISIALICGVLPGLSLLTKNPVSQIRKNKTVAVTKNSPLKNSLVIFQFCISFIAIFSTILIIKQIKHMQNHDPGFATENIMYMELIGAINVDVLHQKLQEIPEISAITYASGIIGKLDTEWGMDLSIAGQEKRVNYAILMVDTTFFDFFNIQLTAGQKFTAGSLLEEHHIFNQTAIQEFAVENITDARITSFENASGNVIGVAEDFNYRSLHYPIQPLGFIYKKPQNLSIAYMKINAPNHQQLNEVLTKLADAWQSLAPDWPFQYGFLDQSLQLLYERDKKFSKIILWATLFSIFIASLGMIGVTTYTLQNRTKEIGIRKVNGAKVHEILNMLNFKYLKMITIAIVFAAPLSWLAMVRWLQHFAYQTKINWWIYGLTGLISLSIALLSVSYLSWKAASRNPVEALKYE
jgi:putative ABC transport system permease protein